MAKTAAQAGDKRAVRKLEIATGHAPYSFTKKAINMRVKRNKKRMKRGHGSRHAPD